METVHPIREHFRRRLDEVHSELINLGEQALAAVRNAIAAFEQSDPGLAQHVVATDPQINLAAHALEERAFVLLATQQPTAGDLRRLLAAITISGELERIADYAKSMARLVQVPALELPAEDRGVLAHMADLAVEMLELVLHAVAATDVTSAPSVAGLDDRVDSLMQNMRDELLTCIHRQPELAETAVNALITAHLLERIADRATNIAERLVFMVSAETVELNP